VSAFLIGTALLLSLAQGAEAPKPAPAPCEAPEYHQFDFWIGDWDTFEIDDSKTVVARNHVDRILLSGTSLGDDGKPMMLRAVWVPEKDRVRETAETSSDDGKTWKPLFDLMFRAHQV
jgi:hypothetical protein